MRGAHVLEALSNMAGAHIIFHLALNHATLRMNHRQAGANILREREQVKLLAQAAVIAALSLSNTVLILHQLILRGPGGTVNTLKHGVLLRTAPIRATGTHERVTVSNQFSIRQVRAAAQVIPQHLTGFRVHIVINRNLARTNLNRGALGGISARTRALTERKQFELIRLVLHLLNRLSMGHHAAAEQLARLDDLNHRLLDLLQILGSEGLSHIKIKIEAVSNIGTNAQLRVLAVFLHRLRHHVRRRMAQHIQAIRFVNENGLNGIALRELV